MAAPLPPSAVTYLSDASSDQDRIAAAAQLCADLNRGTTAVIQLVCAGTTPPVSRVPSFFFGLVRRLCLVRRVIHAAPHMGTACSLSIWVWKGGCMSAPMIHADAADLHIPTSCAQALGLGEWLVSTDATKRSIGTRLLVEASGGTRPNALLTTPPNYMIGLTQPSSPTHHHSGYGHSFKGHPGSPCLLTGCQDPDRGRA